MHILPLISLAAIISISLSTQTYAATSPKASTKACEFIVALGIPDVEFVGKRKVSKDYVELFRLPNGKVERTMDGSINDYKFDDCFRPTADYIEDILVSPAEAL